MVKTLQKKFMITTMFVVSILICGMVGAFNILNYYTEYKEYEKTLDFLEGEMQKEGRPQEGPPPGEEQPQNEKGNEPYQEPPQAPPQGQNMQPHARTREDVKAARFFWVLFSEKEEILEENIKHMASLGQEEAEKKAKEVYDTWKKTGKKEGMIQKLKYRVSENKEKNGIQVIFLDTTTQFYSRLSMLLVSLYVGSICWLLMLFLSFWLSKRAIRPIAENIERQKQFVTNAGHEIKTPLAIITANIDAMELIQGESKWSKNIRNQALRLNGLMQTLLTLSRMEEQTFEKTKVAFSQLIEETVQPYVESVSVRQIQLTTQIARGVTLQGNEESLRQLVSILLDNARKYTQKGGQIQIRLSTENGKVIVEVKNTCDSLPEAPPEKLFERFYRGDDARTQKSGGYGIGLSVAKAIVASHKGYIQAVYGSEPSMCMRVLLPVGQQKKEKIRRRKKWRAQ